MVAGVMSNENLLMKLQRAHETLSAASWTGETLYGRAAGEILRLENALEASDRAFRMLKDQHAKADSELVTLKREKGE